MLLIGCAAVLFDLDGVLIDSTDSITRQWRQWAQRHAPDLAQIMQVAHSRRTVETISLVVPHLPLEQEARRFAVVEAADTAGVVAIDGALPLLAALPPNARAIVASGTREVATARLTSRGLPVPRVMVTADDVANGMPDPEPYLAAANALAVPADRWVVVEDVPAGIAATSAAGMHSVAIASTHAYRELAAALAIAGRLGEIQVGKGRDGSLLVRVTGLDGSSSTVGGISDGHKAKLD